jgi:hypothetical protein
MVTGAHAHLAFSARVLESIPSLSDSNSTKGTCIIAMITLTVDKCALVKAVFSR